MTTLERKKIMELLGMFFLGGMLVVAIAIIALVVFVASKIKKVKREVKNISKMAFGTEDIIKGFQDAELEAQQTPKSLAGMDSIILPRIKKDFPEFNVDVAKQDVRHELKNYLKNKRSVKIHNVVIRDYKKHKFESVIVMQAAAEYIEKDRKQQKRYNFNYVYALAGSQSETNIAAVCPNCGGPVSDTSLANCEYCGSRLVNLIEQSWKVKEIIEC